MRKYCLAFALLLTSFFIAPWQVDAANRTCGEGADAPLLGDEEICLEWFSPEDGSRMYQVFDTDISTSVCKTNKMSCYVGKDGGVSLLDCNGGISTENIQYFDKRFSVLGDARQLVECQNAKGEDQVLDADDKTGWNCKILNPSAIWKKWVSGPILPDEEIVFTDKGAKVKKAIPWNEEGKAYCPDPTPTSAIEAYQLSKDATEIKAAPELVQRYLLSACSTVIKHYQMTCEEAASEVLSGKAGAERKAGRELDLVKSQLIGKLLTGEKKECVGSCLNAWTKVKPLTITDFDFSGAEGEARPEENLATKLSLSQEEIDNLAKWIVERKDDWRGSSNKTLEDFLSSQATTEWKIENDTLTKEAADRQKSIDNANLKEADINEIVSFLRKRYMNLQMHFSLSQSKTYNVTKLLRRSDDSKESELVLFGDSDPEKNIIDKVIRLIGQVLGSFGVLLLIISGVVMIVSQGDETMLQKAKATFMYTLIGLVVAFFSYTIVRFVIELLLNR